MNRFVIVFLSLACVLDETVALSLDSFNDFIRLPLITIPRVRRAADQNGLTKLTLEDPKDNKYGVPIEIGTPAQKFTVLLDSGSSDLWVSSAKSQNKDANSLLDETASTSYQDLHEDFRLGYVGVTVNGTKGTDTVSIGGLTAKNLVFGLASYVTPKATPFDGVMGISYTKAAFLDKTTFIDQLYEQGQIKSKIVCVKLRLKEEAKSQFIVGGCDVEADSWTPVMKINNQYTGYRLNLTKIVLRSTEDNSELGTIETNNEAVLDTGAGFGIGMPPKFLNVLSEKIGAARKTTENGNHLLVDCANRTSLPNVEFWFGEAKVSLARDAYSWTYRDECQVGFNVGGDDFLFGDTFFNQATVIFDRDNDRIGFGPK